MTFVSTGTAAGADYVQAVYQTVAILNRYRG